MEPLSPARCSINTATLGYKAPIATVIDEIARHGFGAIAPWRRDVEGGDIRAISRQIRDAGLAVSGYCRSSYMPAAEAGERRRIHEENLRALRDAGELRAACFVIVAGGLAPGSRDITGARQQVLDGLAALLPEARDLGVALAIEPLHPMYAADRSCVNTIAQALAMCDQLDPSNQGGVDIAIDAYHTWWDPTLHESIAHAGAARRISAFHICDWLNPTRDMLMDRGMMGDGVIDLRSMRESMEHAGYRSFAEIEIFSDRWGSEDSARTLNICRTRLQTAL